MKVPIDVDDDAQATGKPEAAQDERVADGQASEAAQDSASQDKPHDGLTPEEEEALVEAAKRAGEAAAADDMRKDADKARQERDDLQRQASDLQDQLEAAKKEAADATDRLVRLQADWENYRRRTAQERLDERERAAEKLVTNLLPVLDDMERAAQHAEQNMAGDDNLAQFVKGVNAVHDKMLGVLAREGVEVIDPAGQPFDPLVHQAVGREENKDAYDESVAQVYQKGYRMGGKVIRTAMVTVTYGGPKRPAEEAPGQDGEDAPDAGETADKQ